MPTVWTIGHSTRPIADFLKLLQGHGIERLIDVRTIPRSRHNPQFNTESLAHSLARAGISYRHVAALGGLRKAKKGSANVGWLNASFRGYADYMQTEQFWTALEDLIASGNGENKAIMCAEAVPWRCHRSLIADALVRRSCEVRHIMSEVKAGLHQFTSFAKLDHGMIQYPNPEGTPRLF